jgi:chromate transporter
LGTKGAVAATIGMITPAFLAIILLASIFSEIVSKPTVTHIFWGVGIGIVVLLFLAVKEMWKKSVTDKFSALIYIVSLICALSGKVSLSLIIILSVIVGIVGQKLIDKKTNGGVEK